MPFVRDVPSILGELLKERVRKITDDQQPGEVLRPTSEVGELVLS